MKEKMNQKKIVLSLLCGFLFTWILFLQAQVMAKSTEVTNIREYGATASSVDITFDSTLNSLGVGWMYYVEASTNEKNGFMKYADTEINACTLSGLLPATKYYVRITPYALDEDGNKVYRETSDIYQVKTAPGQKVSNVKQTAASDTAFAISWNPVNGADGYYVSCKENNGQIPEDADVTPIATTAVNFTFDGLKKNKNYTVTITPYCKDEKGYIACDDTARATITGFCTIADSSNQDAANLSCVNNIKQISATTDTVGIRFSSNLNSLGAEWRYYVEASTYADRGFFKCGDTETNVCTLNGLAPATEYYIRITPHMQGTDESVTGAIYGNTSAVYRVKTAPDKKVTDVKQIASEEKSISLSWKKTKNADGYYVTCVESADSASGETSQKTIYTQKNACTFRELASNKKYSVSIIPYCKGQNGFIAYDENAAITVAGFSTKKEPVTISGIKKLRQTSATRDSVSIAYEYTGDLKLNYDILISKSKNGKYRKLGSTTDTRLMIQSADLAKQNVDAGTVETGTVLNGVTLKPGETYYVKVRPYYMDTAESAGDTEINTKETTVYGKASEPLQVITLPEQVCGIKQTSVKKNSMVVSWKNVKGADGYYVDYCKSGSSSMIKSKICVKKNEILLKNLATNGEYSIYITPFKQSETGFLAYNAEEYTYKCNLPVMPSKMSAPIVDKYWDSLSVIHVRCNAIHCADGYQYQVYEVTGVKAKKLFTKTVKSYESTNLTNLKFGTGKIFKIRCRAYVQTANKKVFGKWSSFTYTSKAPMVTLTQQKQSIVASWDKIQGADRYLIYVSGSGIGAYQKAIVTSKTKASITSIVGNKLKKNANYYVYVIPQKKVGKNYKSLTSDKSVTKIKFK